MRFGYFVAGALFVFAIHDLGALLHGPTVHAPIFSYGADLMLNLVLMAVSLIPRRERVAPTDGGGA